MISQDFMQRWAQFNTEKWKCETRHVKYCAPNSPAYVEGLFFLNKRGKLYLPPLNPYHPLIFHPTPTDKPYKLDSQWHEVAKIMIPDMLKLRGPASFVFPPEFRDIRPFLWSGFKANIKYTYYVDFPFTLEQASTEIRSRIKKADAKGYRTVLSHNMADVYECMQGTESRQGFSHHMNLEDLKLAQNILGEQVLRSYVCYSKEGEPVSTDVVVALNEKRAIGWISSCKTEHLSHGIAQQSHYFCMQDLFLNGYEGLDFAGANLPSVAKAKSHWGTEITPYYLIRTPGYREVLRAGRDWLQFYKKR